MAKVLDCDYEHATDRHGRYMVIHGDIILTQKLGYDLGPLGKKKKKKQFHEERRQLSLQDRRNIMSHHQLHLPQ